MLRREILADAEPVAVLPSLCRLARIDVWSYPDLSAPYWRCYAVLDPGAELVLAGHRHPLLPGRATLIAPGTAFAARNHQPFRKLYLHFTWSQPGWSVRPGVHDSPLDPGHMGALERIAAGEPAALSRLGLAIIGCALARLPSAALVADGGHPPEVRRALARIRADPARVPGNAALAREAGCHPGSLVRSFTASVGMPPQRYAMGLRLERAAALLAAGDEAIDAIAAACGFCDRNHFTRAFTRRWRCPPAEYRRRNGG